MRITQECGRTIAKDYPMNFLERPQDIKNSRKIPMIMAQTCTDFNDFSKSNYVDQIDGGS
jgi:hypothetical protein